MSSRAVCDQSYYVESVDPESCGEMEQERAQYVESVIQFLTEHCLLGLFRPNPDDAEWLQEYGVDIDCPVSDQEMVYQFLDWVIEQDDPTLISQLITSGCPVTQMMYDYLTWARYLVQSDGERFNVEQAMIQHGIEYPDARLMVVRFAARLCDTPEEVTDLRHLIQAMQEHEICSHEPSLFRLTLDEIDWDELATDPQPILMAEQEGLAIHYLGRPRNRVPKNELEQMLQLYSESWAQWI